MRVVVQVSFGIHFHNSGTHLYDACNIKKCPGGGALECQGGYQASPKIHEKRVFFHSWALYVGNLNRVSNSCEIGLKGYDFLEKILRI